MVHLFQWILLFLSSFLFFEIFANYDTRGWTSQQGTIDYDQGYGVVVSNDGFIYATGYTSGSLNGQPYEGEQHLNYLMQLRTNIFITQGDRDIFLIKYDSTGTIKWTSQQGTAGTDSAN